MDGNVRSAVVAGVIAAVVWIVITLVVGGFTAAAVWGGGAAFLVGTTIVSYLIGAMVRRSRVG
ncbi:MAG: hypothetical protein ABI181_11525 [Mycobacteriaceae bacterium]